MLRSRLLEGIEGRVLEIGCGHGLNFPYFATPRVSHVTALEPNVVFRRAAKDSLAHEAGTRCLS